MELATPARMVVNAAFVLLFVGFVAASASPADVSRPGEYAQWLADLAATHPQYAALVAGLCLVVVLFGQRSEKPLRIGERW